MGTMTKSFIQAILSYLKWNEYVYVPQKVFPYLILE
jgi:hypothetical protein